MAKITETAEISITATFTISEGELRALDALTGYGVDSFMECFYKHMGATYMKPYDKDMREFLKSIREIAGPILSRANEARKIFGR